MMSGFFPNIFRRGVFTSQTAQAKDPRRCPTPNPEIPPYAHPGGYKLYKNLFMFVGLPAILIVAAFVYMKKKEHECEPRPPFVKYDYLRRRTKRFPWGDGTKSFFHNPKVNPLPDGYEDEVADEC